MQVSSNSSLFYVFILFTIATLSAIFLKHKKCQSMRKEKLPPGDMGLPWIGETMEFYKAQRKNKLFEEFVRPRMIKHGNVFKTNLMGSPTIVVNGAEANRFFLSNEFKLVISSWPTTSVQLMGKNCIMEKQGEHHRCVRALIASSLSHAALEALVPKICKSVQQHLNNNWNGKDKISLYRSTKILTFTIVFKCLLGIDVEAGTLSSFERVLEGVFAAPLAIPGSKFWRAKKARKEIEKMLVQVVKKKRKEMMEKREEEEKSTLLCRLVGGMIRGEMNEEEIIDNVVLLVFAAHDTTSFAIAMVFRMLDHHRDCYDKLVQEQMKIMEEKGEDELRMDDIKKMKYTWQVGRESMRLFPPIFGSFRKAITDIEFQGFAIPTGWKVLWTTYGTHYNQDYFEDPLSFNPNRFEEGNVEAYAYLPFGGGPRICAGTQLAKLNILIFMHYVSTRYNWSLIYPHEDIIMDPLPLPSLGMPISVSPKFHSTFSSALSNC